VGSVLIAAAGAAGCAAILSRPDGGPLDVIPTVVGTLSGITVLRILTRKGIQRQDDSAPNQSRRQTLTACGLLIVGALAGAVGGIVSRRLQSVAGERNAAVVPPAATPALPVPPGVQPKDVALPSFVTDNADFYRIDTALLVPQVSRADWRLRIHGMVDRETTYSFDDLGEFDVVEKAVTLTCVSNPVGGDLIGNAVWRGYRVRDLLARAGIHRDADMVLSTSTDGSPREPRSRR
jgi:DMSO/TMAO reductase YedYZ molybdopterin-dependent catalytic subunit